MFIVDAIDSALPPPSFSMSPGTVGRNAGSTTPDVLEYADTRPMMKPKNGITVACVAMLDSRFVKISMPPASSRPISTVTPQTIRIVLHGIFLIASPSSAARSSDSSTAAANAAMPMLKPPKITPRISMPIMPSVMVW